MYINITKRFAALFLILFFIASCQDEENELVIKTSSDIYEPNEPVLEVGSTDLTKIPFIGNNFDGQIIKSGTDGNPIIFIHGFLGFGDDEAFGVPYWGPFTDILKTLNNEGYPAFAASVGPISSAHERAVELYYQIKGGCVDYGEMHSKNYNHNRFVNKCYDGFYPEWDSSHPVHLVGHSFGGNTSSLLAHYLENGLPEELQSGNQVSSLFKGNKKNWIKTISTIATPNNGTSLSDNALFFEDILIPGITAFIAALGATPLVNIYSFDLEHYDIVKEEGESIFSYISKVSKSEMFNARIDHAIYDLSVEGVEILNNLIVDSPDIYYFSYSAQSTFEGLITGWHHPTPFIFPFTGTLASTMGRYTGTAGSITIDSSWWPNDGVVNTISQKAPFNSIQYPMSLTPTKGAWNYFPTFQGIDHLDIIGFNPLINVNDFYLGIAGLVSSVN